MDFAAETESSLGISAVSADPVSTALQLSDNSYGKSSNSRWLAGCSAFARCGESNFCSTKRQIRMQDAGSAPCTWSNGNGRCVSRRVDVWLLPGFPICSTPYALVAKLQYCRLRSVAIAVLVLGGRTNDRSREIASAVCAARDVMQEPTSGYFHGHTSSSTVTVHGSDDSAGSGTFECARADRCRCSR